MDDANAVDVAGVPASTLNLIDLSSSDIRRSASLLKQARLDSGFFYVINHGVSQDLMEEVFVQSRRFFGLPLSEEMKLLRNEKHRGYTPLFDQVLHPANQINAILGEPIVTLCLLHYEGPVSDPSEGIYGAGAHSDFGFSTLLATDDVSGLQICKNKDAKPLTWKYVQHMRGAFIINLSDMQEHGAIVFSGMLGCRLFLCDQSWSQPGLDGGGVHPEQAVLRSAFERENEAAEEREALRLHSSVRSGPPPCKADKWRL